MKFTRNMILVAAAGAAMAACAPSPAPSAGNSAAAAPTGGAALAGGEWKVFEINGQPIVEHSNPSITFEDGRAFGAGSCNRFMGGYTVSDDGLKLSMQQMASTMMACEDSKMKQEYVYLKTLGEVTGYTVTDGVLTLTAPEGQSIRARR